jgi:nucleoside-diphosphate-sugar epimerase
MTTALICGISGQDGSYLAKLLVEKGYRVVGTSRNAQLASFSNLKILGVYDKVREHPQFAIRNSQFEMPHPAPEARRNLAQGVSPGNAPATMFHVEPRRGDRNCELRSAAAPTRNSKLAIV